MSELKGTQKVKTDDYRLWYYKNLAETTNDQEDINKYYEVLNDEEKTKKIFELFVKAFDLPKRNYGDKIDFKCYENLVEYYKSKNGLNIIGIINI